MTPPPREIPGTRCFECWWQICTPRNGGKFLLRISRVAVHSLLGRSAPFLLHSPVRKMHDYGSLLPAINTHTHTRTHTHTQCVCLSLREGEGESACVCMYAFRVCVCSGQRDWLCALLCVHESDARVLRRRMHVMCYMRRRIMCARV